MSFTYDTSNNIGKVRFLVGDTVDSGHLFEDGEITDILSLNSIDIYATAADFLMRLAASKSLLAKKKSAGGYSEDLSVIARECRETAKVYLERSSDIPAEAQAEMILTDFNYNQILRNKSLRRESE